MRIISGTFKSRLIDYPKTDKTRPLTDRMKETIFNVLGQMLDNKKVLDLFAGSGSFGLEAISRRASRVFFVDEEPLAWKVIQSNLKSLGITDRHHPILRLPMSRAVKHLQQNHEQFDLVFIDPPYDSGLIKKTLRLLERFDIVQNFGIVVIHRSPKEALPEDLGNLRLLQEKKIGQAFVDFLEKTNPSETNDTDGT